MEDGIRNIEKGNTEIVAKTIQRITGGDLFRVEEVISYPYNYQECCDVAKSDLYSNKLPELKNYLSDISKYDVIYIGGPVWWGHYPTPMFTLLSRFDFKDKKIKYFTTHEGSGLGSVLSDVKKYCKNATILDGLAIRGSDSEHSEKIIENWIKK